MIAAHNLCWSISQKSILQDIDFSADPGELVVFLGTNGAGKSSLFRCLSGWTRPTSGTALLNGTPAHRMAPNHRANLLGWLPQKQQLSDPILVKDAVACGRFRFQETAHTKNEKVKEALHFMEISSLAEQRWDSLSGGEAQRVSLATLHAQEATAWLLDEPANHLDPAVQQQVYQKLITWWLGGGTLLLITHDLNLLFQTVPQDKHSQVRIIGLADGCRAFESHLAAEELSTHIGALYNLEVSTFTAFGTPHLAFGKRP